MFLLGFRAPIVYVYFVDKLDQALKQLETHTETVFQHEYLWIVV